MFDFSQGWAGMTFGSSGTGIDSSISEDWEPEGKKPMKSIPTIRERESEAICPRNTQEREQEYQEKQN